MGSTAEAGEKYNWSPEFENEVMEGMIDQGMYSKKCKHRKKYMVTYQDENYPNIIVAFEGSLNECIEVFNLMNKYEAVADHSLDSEHVTPEQIRVHEELKEKGVDLIMNQSIDPMYPVIDRVEIRKYEVIE